jgi:hypothetical protein
MSLDTPPRPMPLRNGVDYTIEEDADRLLADDRRRNGVQDDYLSKDQMNLRRQKEIYNVNGVSEEMMYSGLFRREHNPLFGHRPTGLRSRDDG